MADKDKKDLASGPPESYLSPIWLKRAAIVIVILAVIAFISQRGAERRKATTTRQSVQTTKAYSAVSNCPEVPAPPKGEKIRENKSCFKIRVAEGEETGWILYPFWARSASAHPLQGKVESWLYGASEPLIVSPGKVPRLVIPVGPDGEVYKFKGIDAENVMEIRFMQEKDPFTGASVY